MRAKRGQMDYLYKTNKPIKLQHFGLSSCNRSDHGSCCESHVDAERIELDYLLQLAVFLLRRSASQTFCCCIAEGLATVAREFNSGELLYVAANCITWSREQWAKELYSLDLHFVEWDTTIAIRGQPFLVLLAYWKALPLDDYQSREARLHLFRPLWMKAT